MPVINNSVCETMYRSAGYIEHIPEIFICAGWRKGGFDSCEVSKLLAELMSEEDLHYHHVPSQMNNLDIILLLIERSTSRVSHGGIVLNLVTYEN